MIPFFDRTPAAPKICGITSAEDAISCIRAGAGALGFNFYPPSPRSLRDDDDLGWIKRLKADHGAIAMIAVTVDPQQALVRRLQTAGCFDAIQFHGDESPESCLAQGALFSRWIKALRVRTEADLTAALLFQTPYLLLDAAVPGSYGGSGQTVDWSLASGFVAAHPEKRVILAGGLKAENVAEAILTVRPHAVDAASGVESAPGVKDPLKAKAFIAGTMAG